MKAVRFTLLGRLYLLLIVDIVILTNLTFPVVSGCTFRAGVYDRPPRTSYSGDQAPSRQQVLHYLQPAFNLYTQQAQNASQQGVDIIVFPEYGLYPTDLSYEAMTSFAESVPDPSIGWNPCSDPDRYPDTDIQYFLSCLAFSYDLYVVANFGDLVSCDNAVGQKCNAYPELTPHVQDDSVSRESTVKNQCKSKQYNTNVAYDPSGKQVARYHKYNLFTSEADWYDTPNSPQYSYFDTPFGRIGSVVCFDLLFKEPVISLIEDYHVDTIAFSTAWMNVLPYFSAVPFHWSFSRGHNINFLSSNIHDPVHRFSGSGIFTSNAALNYRNDEASNEGILLIADLPASPSKTFSVVTDKSKIDLSDRESWQEFTNEVFADEWTFTWLSPIKNAASVCSNNLCCRLDYIQEHSNEHFALGAFDGLHTSEGRYYLQLCGVMRCGNASQSSCGSAGVRTSSTFFNKLTLTGNYSSKYRYPQVVTDGVDPASGQWGWDGQTLDVARTDRPLVSAIVLTRLYDRDADQVLSIDIGPVTSSAISSNISCIFKCPLIYIVTEFILMLFVSIPIL